MTKRQKIKDQLGQDEASSQQALCHDLPLLERPGDVVSSITSTSTSTRTRTRTRTSSDTARSNRSSCSDYNICSSSPSSASSPSFQNEYGSELDLQLPLAIHHLHSTNRNKEDLFHVVGTTMNPNKACCICGGGTYSILSPSSSSSSSSLLDQYKYQQNNHHHRFLQEASSSSSTFFPVPIIISLIFLSSILLWLCIHYLRQCYKRKQAEEAGVNENQDRGTIIEDGGMSGTFVDRFADVNINDHDDYMNSILGLPRVPTPPPPEPARSNEEIEKDRRKLIMNNIIRKSVITKKGGDDSDGTIILPHGEILMKREISLASFNINNPIGSNHVSEAMMNDWSGRSAGLNLTDSEVEPAYELSGGEENSSSYGNSRNGGGLGGVRAGGALYDLSGGDGSAKNKRKKNSDRNSLKKNILLNPDVSRCSSRDTAPSLYSPAICPICIERYKEGEEIAWSLNERCHHAFHYGCISDWLMKHDECPMCRMNYLNLDESGEA